MAPGVNITSTLPAGACGARGWICLNGPYANASGYDPDAAYAPAPSSRPLLDRWILSRLARTVHWPTPREMPAYAWLDTRHSS